MGAEWVLTWNMGSEAEVVLKQQFCPHRQWPTAMGSRSERED